MKRHSRRLIASLLAGITISTSVASPVLASSLTSYNSETLGSIMSLGSPLSNEGFEVEDWNEWEMVAFGIFISNFVEPFADDYNSAFTEGSSKGSQGAGAKALQFNAGGDFNAGGTLTQMLEYCKATQAKGGSAVKVRYDYYEYDHKMNVDLGSRDAYLDDLFPRLYGLGDPASLEMMDVFSSNLIDRPLITVHNNNRRAANGGGTGTHQVEIGSSGESDWFTGEETYLPYYVANQSFIPKFYVGEDIDKGTVLDYSNGFDLNMAAALLSKVNNPEGVLATVSTDMQAAVSGNDGINDMLGQKYKLYFDAFGNICIFKDDRYVVVLPAACNKNLHKDKSVNLLNSLVVNGFMVGSSPDKMAAQSSSQVMTAGSISEFMNVSDKIGAIGLPAVCILSKDKDINKSNVGKLIAYSDTDTYLIPSIMKYLNDETATKKSDKIDLVDATDGEGNVAGKTKAGTDLGGLYYDETKARRVEVSKTDMNYGKVLEEMLDDNSLNNANFKIEVTGADPTAFKETGKWIPWKENTTVATDIVSESQLGLSVISNMFPYKLGDKALTYMYVVSNSKDSTKNKQDLFDVSQSYYLTPGVNPLRSSTTFYKSYMNYLLQYASGKLSGANDPVVSPDSVRTSLFEIESPITLLKRMVFDGTVPKFYPLVESFAKAKYEIKDASDLDKKMQGEDSDKLSKALKSAKSAYSKILTTDTNITKSSGTLAVRICKVYAPSDYFVQVANVFDLDPSTQFKSYVTDMYLTYLKYYGLMDNEAKFDTNLFLNTDFLNLDAGDYVKTMSTEDKEKEIKNNQFLIGNTGKAGREYRKSLFDGLVKDSLASGYSNIINGTTDASGQQVGFLNVSSYKDNVFTAWVFEHYDNIAIVLFGTMFIIAFMYGILSKQGVTWFILMACTMMISISAVPKYTEITPYICNRVIQKAFGGNTIYWAAVEDINNVKINAEARKNSGNPNISTGDKDEEQRILTTLKQQSILQQDKALLVKNDISKKVIEALDENFSYDKLQQMASTRWLLPSLMRQISGDNGSSSYVYNTLNDLFSNMSQSYLLMNKDAGSEHRKPAKYNPTDYDGTGVRTNDWKTSQWSSYKDTASAESDVASTYKSITRVDGSASNSHTGVYFLESNALGLPSIGNDGEITTKTWDAYAEGVVSTLGGKQSVIDAIHGSLVADASNYNANDDAIGTSFPYLWSTENIGVYMYSVVNDTFQENISNRSLESVAFNILQSVAIVRQTKNADGTVTSAEIEEGTPIPDGVEVKDTLIRKNFMFQGSTGYIRDFLDLEEIFTNMIPYMYQMQVTMTGTNGKNGMIGDKTLGDNVGSIVNPIAYSVYKDNEASWLYRSNWVTKIMTDKKWTGEGEVRWVDSSGALQKAKVVSMVNPRNYPAERPMIFSEAQMYNMGLNESYLNQLELRLLKINEEVERQWTELVNYINIEGVTKETIYRLMALEATITFNKELTNKGLFDDTRQLFPYSLDLRNISFDSLMRKLLVSSSKSSSYSSVEVMENVVTNSGAFIGILVIIVAFISATVVPFIRDVVLVGLLALTVLSIILNVYNGHKEKLKATGGWLITYVIFALVTSAFYWLFAMTIGTGTVDSLITSSSTLTLSMGSLSMKLLLLLVVDAAYLYIIGRFIWKVLIKGDGLSFVKDGGFGFFYDLANSANGHLNSGFKNVGNGFRQAMASSTTLNPDNVAKVEVMNKTDNSVNTTIQDGLVGTTEEVKRNNRTKGIDNQYDDSGYTIDEIIDKTSKSDTDAINNKIDSASRE